MKRKTKMIMLGVVVVLAVAYGMFFANYWRNKKLWCCVQAGAKCQQRASVEQCLFENKGKLSDPHEERCNALCAIVPNV